MISEMTISPMTTPATISQTTIAEMTNSQTLAVMRADTASETAVEIPAAQPSSAKVIAPRAQAPAVRPSKPKPGFHPKKPKPGLLGAPAVLWRVMAVTEAVAEPETALPEGGEMELWPYRDRTVALLKRYARSSVEVGRLPSLLGREFFRSRITSYSMMSFEDIVIFVLDVEMALDCLKPLHRQLIAMSVLEDYSFPEVARLVPCPLRTVERELPEALDELSRFFLEGGLIRGLPMGRRGAEPRDYAATLPCARGSNDR